MKILGKKKERKDISFIRRSVHVSSSRFLERKKKERIHHSLKDRSYPRIIVKILGKKRERKD